MSQKFISFRLRATSIIENAEWYFINLDKIRLVKMTEERIDFFDNQSFVTISKFDHPEAFSAIRNFLMNSLEGNYNIVEEEDAE